MPNVDGGRSDMELMQTGTDDDRLRQTSADLGALRAEVASLRQRVMQSQRGPARSWHRRRRVRLARRANPASAPTFSRANPGISQEQLTLMIGKAVQAAISQQVAGGTIKLVGQEPAQAPQQMNPEIAPVPGLSIADIKLLMQHVNDASALAAAANGRAVLAGNACAYGDIALIGVMVFLYCLVLARFAKLEDGLRDARNAARNQIATLSSFVTTSWNDVVGPFKARIEAVMGLEQRLSLEMDTLRSSLTPVLAHIQDNLEAKGLIPPFLENGATLRPDAGFRVVLGGKGFESPPGQMSREAPA